MPEYFGVSAVLEQLNTQSTATRTKRFTHSQSIPRPLLWHKHFMMSFPYPTTLFPLTVPRFFKEYMYTLHLTVHYSFHCWYPVQRARLLACCTRTPRIPPNIPYHHKYPKHCTNSWNVELSISPLGLTTSKGLEF